MNTKHTPGPWTHGSAYLSGVADIRDKSGDLIAQVVSGTFIGMKEQSANARLIAAAPELLEALQAIVGKGIAGIPERFDDLTTMQMDVLVKAIWDGRAAIAKATDTTNL